MNNGKYIVAGGTSGIGLEISKQLLELGHEVITMGRSNPVLANEAEHHLYDFASNDAPPQLSGPVDGLFYCPGSILLKPLNTLREEDLIADFRLNAVGAFRMVKAYRSLLAQAQFPGIVLFSSVAATTGMPFHTSLSMAKGAVEGLARALSAELAPAIRVNCIAPSLTDTPLAQGLLNNEAKREANAQRHPLKRIGTASEVAALAVFLMTQANWMTGQVVGLNGGIGSLIK